MIQISGIIHNFDNSKLITAHGNHQRNPRRIRIAIFEEAHDLCPIAGKPSKCGRLDILH